jgi:Fe-S-cluster-containing dehydrogenase component
MSRRKSSTRGEKSHGRREFIKKAAMSGPVLLSVVRFGESKAGAQESDYNPEDHYYGMGIDISKCIGCGQCVEACKTENDVPRVPFYFRTWVERYVILENGETLVDSPGGGIDGFPPPPVDPASAGGRMLRTFFVPKLCNHCDNPPCVQVCPVGATFTTQDGVVLVDRDYCIGCRYCIQACPYGARFMHPETHTAEKCTFCYHRVVQGLRPACVEVCPTGARLFGEIRSRSTPLARFVRFNEIQTLKLHLNTEPKVYYAHLDGEVS